MKIFTVYVNTSETIAYDIEADSEEEARRIVEEGEDRPDPRGVKIHGWEVTGVEEKGA